MDQLDINDGSGNTLSATEDGYNGVIVEMKEHMDADVFQTLLKTSLLNWKLQGKKGVWLRLPIELANLVKPAVKEGFWYHHAEPKYVMLVRWLPETLPENDSRIVRVNATVVDDKQQDGFGPCRRSSVFTETIRPISAAKDEPGSAENEEHTDLEASMLPWELEQVMELKRMKHLKSDIDKDAKNNARRVLWIGLGILAVVDMIFLALLWILPWNVMEIVYVSLTLAFFVFGYGFYAKTLKEPSLKEGFEVLFGFFKARAMTSQGFDMGKYRRLKKAHGHRFAENSLQSLV